MFPPLYRKKTEEKQASIAKNKTFLVQLAFRQLDVAVTHLVPNPVITGNV